MTGRKKLLFPILILLIIAGCKRNKPVNEQLDISEFLIEDISVVTNPSGRVPLSAEATVKTDIAVEIEWTVNGDHPLSLTRDFGSKVNTLPIVGLYPDQENIVTLTLSDINGNWATTDLKIQTDPLPDYMPTVEVTAKDEAQMAEGWHVCGWSYGTGTDFESRPFMIDPDGNVRWYLEFTDLTGVSLPIRVLDNGNFIVAHSNNIYELDWLGNSVRHIPISGYKQHHEVQLLPNGNLLVAVNKESIATVDDHVIEIDQSGNVVHEWDLRPLLDMDRFDLVNDPVDWFHMNAIFYSESDDCLVISGRNQGVVKINRNNELLWILAPHKGWGKAGPNGDGHETSDFLLTAVDGSGTPYNQTIQEGDAAASDFDWTWGQHACMYLPNGNLFVYDNGFNRQFMPNGAGSYSRAVEYRIDEGNMTIDQVWQYGKSRTDAFSPIISDVDLLPNDNRLMHSGIIFDASDPRTTIMEVTYPGKMVVWEATLHHKNMNAGGTFAWGDFDLTYRSERVDLEGFDW